MKPFLFWRTACVLVALLILPGLAAAQGSGIGGSGVRNPPTSAQIITALGYTPANKAGDTFSGPVTIGGSSLSPFTATSTDAGAALGPIANLYRNSASPAANDVIGGVNLSGNSSTGVERVYGALRSTIKGTTNGAEYGRVSLHAVNNGTLVEALTVDFDVTNRILLGTAVNGIGGNGNQLTMGYTNAGIQAQFSSAGLLYHGSLPVGWGAGTFGTMDAYFTRQGAGQVALSTDSTHGAVFDVTSDNYLRIVPRSGTAVPSTSLGIYADTGGNSRRLDMGVNSSKAWMFANWASGAIPLNVGAGNEHWQFNSSQHFTPLTDGGQDLGGATLGVRRYYTSPAVAPSAPTTSGAWAVYVDSGDGNKLKAIASTGTIVTLGTP